MVIIHANVNCRESDTFDYNSCIKEFTFGVVVFKSPAEVFLDDSYVKVEPGTAVVWRGKDNMRYRAVKGTSFIHDFAYFGYGTSGISFFSKFPVKTPIKLINMEELSRTLQMIIDEARLKNDYYSDFIQHLNFLYLLKLKREIALQSKIPDNRAHYQKMYTLRNFMYTVPENDWTVASMSAAVHLSESHFQHLYRYYFGDSCMNDVIKARLATAKKMLKHTDMKISQISEKCGYKNVEHFTRQFKNLTDMTPGRYRQKSNGSLSR